MTIKYKKEPRTIALKGTYILKEDEAASTINPGQLVEFTTINGKRAIKIQGTSGVNCRRAIALENDLLGKGIDDNSGGKTNSTIAETYKYTLKENVRYAVFKSGCEVLARFKVTTAGEAITFGKPLMAGGDGNFKLWVNDPGGVNAVIGFSLESLTAGAANAEMFLKVEII